MLSSIRNNDEYKTCIYMFLCMAMVQGQPPYTIEEFKNETSEIRIIGAHWELITYVPLSDYDLRHYQLESEIKNMDKHYKGNMSILKCVLTSKYNNISVQQKQMYESIGRYFSPTTIQYQWGNIQPKERGLVNIIIIIGTAMKTLFGVCDEECAEETLNIPIAKVENSNERVIHIVIKDQTTVVNTSIVG
ncbi:Uncharacterized protein FWK35_00032261, partial [Aphis craccivora]